MAKAQSTAPKERINVTFKPATGNAVEEIELPMKVAVLGDFLNRHDARPLLDRKPVSVNKNNFGEVMEKQELSVQLAVPNRLRDGQEDTDINASLKFASMKDFEPENVARQIPEMAKLLQLREALVSLKGPLGNIPAFREAIQKVLADDKQRDQVMKELGLTEGDLANLQADSEVGATEGDTEIKDKKPQK